MKNIKIIIPLGKNLNRNKNYNLTISKNFDILQKQTIRLEIIDNFFSPLDILISNPIINITRDKVIINISYYIGNNNIIRLNFNTVNNLIYLLSEIFSIKVELRLIKHNNPMINAQIFSDYLINNVNEYNFKRLNRFIIDKIIIINNNNNNNNKKSANRYNNNNKLPSYILGIKIIINGQLITEIVRPRNTNIEIILGSFKNDKNTYYDYGLSTNKNNYGRFSIKILIRHNINK